MRARLGPWAAVAVAVVTWPPRLVRTGRTLGRRSAAAAAAARQGLRGSFVRTRLGQQQRRRVRRRRFPCPLLLSLLSLVTLPRDVCALVCMCVSLSQFLSLSLSLSLGCATAVPRSSARGALSLRQCNACAGRIPRTLAASRGNCCSLGSWRARSAPAAPAPHYCCEHSEHLLALCSPHHAHVCRRARALGYVEEVYVDLFV